MHRFTAPEYRSVSLVNDLSNKKKNLFNPFDFSPILVGLKRREHNAGVNDNAINDDSITEMAIVIANC